MARRCSAAKTEDFVCKVTIEFVEVYMSMCYVGFNVIVKCLVEVQDTQMNNQSIDQTINISFILVEMLLTWCFTTTQSK